jgi:hypothetical protein
MYLHTNSSPADYILSPLITALVTMVIGQINCSQGLAKSSAGPEYKEHLIIFLYITGFQTGGRAHIAGEAQAVITKYNFY